MKNKYINIILALSTVVLSVLVNTSCKEDFLDEELKTKRDYAYFNTQAGINDAVITLYNQFRYPFTFEQVYSTTNYGTDEFIVGGDNSNDTWNNYNSNLSPLVIQRNVNTTLTSAIWDNMYKSISMANIVLAYADNAIPDAAKRTVYKAEASFSRAYSYFKLVQQYGGVVLKLEPSEGVERYFTRASKEECMAQIIKDLEDAYNGLPATEPKEGKLYKDVAAHFLAKALLYRCSEINESWNSKYKDADLANIIKYADEVIANHALAPNYRDVFAFTKPNGPNESLPEVIFAAQFSDVNTNVEGNLTHLYCPSQYNNLTGFTRDIAGGREYQRLRTTEYIYDVFDLENDSRFWKSFRTKNILNNSATAGQLSGKDPNTGNNYTYSRGDLGLIYVINSKTDTRFNKSTALVNTKHSEQYYLNPVTGKPTPHTFVRYRLDGGVVKPHVNTIINRFPSLSKHFDGSRPTHNYEKGRRDGIIARVSETYLIKAEALIRQAKYTDAIAVINIVRARGAFKGEEDRAAYTDGGAAYLNNPLGQATYADGAAVNSMAFVNSYYESLNIPVTTAATDLTTGITPTSLPAVDEAIISKFGYSTPFDRMMCYLLNERTRELAGEFVRWEDLARTKTLLKRVTAKAVDTNGDGSPDVSYNPDAAANFNEGKHYLRPIPQTFLDAIYSADGKALTSEEKTIMQNPGY